MTGPDVSSPLVEIYNFKLHCKIGTTFTVIASPYDRIILKDLLIHFHFNKY